MPGHRAARAWLTCPRSCRWPRALDGLYAAGLAADRPGSEGWPVTSDAGSPSSPSPALRPPEAPGRVDRLDLLGTADDSNLAVARPGHTVAVVNTAIVPTAAMVTNRVVLPAHRPDSLERISSVTCPDGNLYLDAQGVRAAVRGPMPTNLGD